MLEVTVIEINHIFPVDRITISYSSCSWVNIKIVNLLRREPVVSSYVKGETLGLMEDPMNFGAEISMSGTIH